MNWDFNQYDEQPKVMMEKLISYLGVQADGKNIQ